MLPDTYEYQTERLEGSFRTDPCAYTRRLALADPQWLFSAAQPGPHEDGTPGYVTAWRFVPAGKTHGATKLEALRACLSDCLVSR